MPELPDLEVIKDVLARRMPGAHIVSVRILRPLVVRNLLGGEISEHLVGQTVDSVKRRGKFLLMTLANGLSLVINPMLAGRLRFGEPLPKDRRRDALIISFADGQELRYFDAKDMGKVYLTGDPGAVPGFGTMGPEANDPSLSLEVFAERLSSYRGEIKGILIRQDFVAGIGNAYSDEILWRAGVYPYRRRTSMTSDEVRSVFEAMKSVMAEAIGTLAERVGEEIEIELRDFLGIQGRRGEACPRCGSGISEVHHGGSSTYFCRQCQPGVLVNSGRRIQNR
jgi:formamidopyrimidine-DNA glycosylase